MEESQKEKMAKMSDQELLNTFFEYGGAIAKEGFLVPTPISFDTSCCFFAIDFLMERKTGNGMLHELLGRFCKGEIDQFGKIK